MNTLERLRKKKKKLIVGLMSGTSADSIDAVLAEIAGSGTSAHLRQIAFASFSYPKGYKEYLLANSLPGKSSVDVISQLNILSAHFFADAVKKVARQAHIPLKNIDLIGSHGQTVQHIPAGEKLFGKQIRSTLQIGDPSTLAQLTGIPVVGNFRTADMALGGQGAPLVPYFDFVMFRSSRKNRCLLNIGGIANITLLKKNCSVNDVIAFDTGPGNMVIDALVKKLYRKEYDAGGSIASRGNILPSALRAAMKHRYFSVRPPKSTGRELFGASFMAQFLALTRGERKEDIIATAAELTALTVFDQYNRFLRRRILPEKLDELIVSGGGTMNGAVMNALAKYFHPAAVMVSDDAGVPSGSKEALCFALLANETINELPSNIPSVTGASRPGILGVIALP